MPLRKTCKCIQKKFRNRHSSIPPIDKFNSGQCLCKKCNKKGICVTVVWDMCKTCRKPHISYECYDFFMKKYGKYTTEY